MAVNLSSLAGAAAQFFDNNGVPLAGGLIYTYAAGTTTPAVTYTSSTGLTAHANPIVLDAAGRVSTGEIWLTTGADYKFLVKTAANVQIGSYDNLPSINVLTNLANTTNPALGDALVGFKQSDSAGNLSGAVGRTVHQKLQEIVSVKDFGAVGNGVADDTVAIQAAIASNLPLSWSAGTYRITQSIICTAAQNWTTAGKVTILNDAANGSAVAPVIDFRDKSFVLGDFTIDQQADTKGFVNPTIYGGELGAGSAILVQGDYSNIDGITVQNAWGNGIFVAKYTSPTTSTFVTGSPKYGSFSNIKTILCGVGDNQGSGINIGSASLCTVVNCVDNASYNGFILDTGGGGQCMFANCQAFQTKRDNAVLGSGYGFYVGGTDSTFANCYSYLSEYRGWWHDTGQNIEYVNCAAYVPQNEGLYMKAGIATFVNFRIKNASAVGLNVADAILIDSSAAAIGLVSIDARIIGTNHRYAVNATGVNNINVFVSGMVTAATAVVPALAANHYVGTNFQSEIQAGLWGFNKNVPAYTLDIVGRTRLTAGVANTSYLVNRFGDVSGNGTSFVEDFATNEKRAAWGYDPVNDCFVAQSIYAGVAVKPFFINPSGGDVMVGTGVWTSPMRLGAYRLWVDGSGVLRIKNGAPTSDTDGTVVGTQT